MNINFSFDEKNVQVGFENQFVVKDFTNKTLVKLLMLKGEKGDTASYEWGNITGSITNQTDLSNALNNKADTTDIPTDLNQLSNTTTKFVNENQLQAVITSLGSIFTLKGSVATVNDLPSQNNNIGDVYYVVSESAGYIWIDDDGTLRWEQLGMTVDTSDFLTKSGLLSSTGNSTTNTMHQSAITSALYNKADTTDIPTKTSDLTNDSGFITTETDPVFTNSVAHEITSTDITNWNNKSTFSGNYNDLTNKPNIPTKTSDLTNDNGFITSSYHDNTKVDKDSIARVTNVVSKNLVSKVINNENYNEENQQFEFANSFSHTDYIPIELNKTYIFSHQLNLSYGGIVLFDENYNYLGKISHDNILAPFLITNENCKYIIIKSWDPNNNSKVNETWMQLEEGSVATPYTQYLNMQELQEKTNDAIKSISFNVSANSTTYILLSTDIASQKKPLLLSIVGSGSFFEMSVLIHLYRINQFAMYNNQLSKYIYDNHDWLNIEFENSDSGCNIKLTNTNSDTNISGSINIIKLYE